MAAALKCDQVLTPDQLIQTVITGPATHVCQTNGWMFHEEMQTAQVLARDNELYFKAPVTSILFPSKVGKVKEKNLLLYDHSIRSWMEKSDVLDEMKLKIQPLTKSITFLDEVVAVADEFVTNALYNAPYVDPVTHFNRRSTTSRRPSPCRRSKRSASFWRRTGRGY